VDKNLADQQSCVAWRPLGLHGDKEASSLIEQLPKLSALGVNVLASK